MTEPRYPNIEVQLTGTDGNAFGVMGLVSAEMRKAGVSADERGTYTREAISGDYDNLLAVTMRWVTVS